MAPAPAPICNAPFSSLYLEPTGEVRACCQNQWLRLGRIGTSTLSEIWAGPALEALRRAVASGDLTLGCELCALAHRRGSPETAFHHVFASIPPASDRPAYPQRLELAISNACNLQCTMCNGDLSSAIRIHREHRPPVEDPYDEAFFADLDAFLPHLREVVLLGGEPFLAPSMLRVLERLIELGLAPSVHVTTNGTQWSPRVERLLEALPMHVAVSIDGTTEETFQAIRVGATLARVRANLDRYRTVLARSGGSASISFSLQRRNWHELGEFLAWAHQESLPVFVNEVVHPSWASLLHARTDELQGVLESLEVQSSWVEANAPSCSASWWAVLDQIRGELAARRTEVPVVVSGGHDPVDVRRRELARALAAEGGAEVVAFRVGRSGTLDDISPDPGDAFGLDLRSQVGGSLLDATRAVTGALGELVRSSTEHHPDGVEVRRLEMVGDRGRVVVAMALAPDQPDGETWFVGLRTGAAAAQLDPRAGSVVA